MTRRYTKYDGAPPVFPGISEYGIEFFEECHGDGCGIVLVDADGIVGELVNPSDKPTKKWFGKSDKLWRFEFGASGTTFLLVWSKGVESALELAADWLETNAPGHLMAADSEELKSLIDEAREELGEDADDDEVEQKATADLRYTESGYLTSHEWTVDEVSDKKIVEAALYASDLADWRFHEAPNGIEILEKSRGDVYLFLNPETVASQIWNVDAVPVGNSKDSVGVVVMADTEKQAERAASSYLANAMLGREYGVLAGKVDDSDELYWAASAIANWARSGRQGPFKLLPEIEGGDQTPNARAQSGGHPIPVAKGGGVVVVYIDNTGDWTAVFSGGQWDKEANHGMHQMYGREGWGDGHAGSHLGKKMRWEDVPEHIRRRIESQININDMQTPNADREKDKRLRCSFCGMTTWSTDYKQFMADHDRPDGRRCLRAAAEVEPAGQQKNARRVNAGGSWWSVKYTHKISPSPKDVGPDVRISDNAFSNDRTLAKALREAGVLERGASIRSSRSEGDKVIIFPSLPGSTTYWHSITLTHLENEP